MESRTGEPGILPNLDIFAYTPRETEDLFSLNARLGLRYDTLATPERRREQGCLRRTGGRILIPSQDGLFVNDPPRGDLEDDGAHDAPGRREAPPVAAGGPGTGRWEPVSFFPDDSFSRIERAFFLRILYRNPIDKGRITSPLRLAKRPVHGEPGVPRRAGHRRPGGHPGARGARRDRGGGRHDSDVLGRYVVLTHPGGYQTVYGHLSAINVTIGERVSTGAILGAVGHTGHATGPHLHFEVRTRAGTRDPLQLLRMKKR